MLVFIIFNGRLEKGPQKIQNVNFFQSGGGGLTPKFKLNKIFFWGIDKKSKINFKNFTFRGGRGGGQGQFGKKLTF